MACYWMYQWLVIRSVMACYGLLLDVSMACYGLLWLVIRSYRAQGWCKMYIDLDLLVTAATALTYGLPGAGVV